MKNIPSAEEFLKEKYNSDLNSFQDNVENLKEFTKLHLEEQQKAILEKAEIDYEPHWSGEQEGSSYINRDSILNAYPIENVK